MRPTKYREANHCISVHIPRRWFAKLQETAKADTKRLERWVSVSELVREAIRLTYMKEETE